MTVPQYFVAGDTVSWVVSAQGDRTSATYTLQFALRGTQVLTVAGVADGDGWRVSLTAAQTAALPAGDYSWQQTITDGTDRFTVGQGRVKIQPNIEAQPVGFDGRTQAEKDLTTVQAEIRARVSGGASLNYTIGTRSLAKEPISALLQLESKLKADVAREKMAERLASGMGNPRSIFIRFGG
jgi:hypothetical protein